MKKILYLIPLFLLFLIPKAYALPNCNSISSATLYDIYNSSSVSAISTNKTMNSSLLCGNAWYTGATSDNTQGLGWEVKLADLNNKDFYYQLNVYYHLENVGGGTPNIIASPHRYNNIAIGSSNVPNLWTSGNLGVTDLSYTINTYSIENGYEYFVVSYIFKSTTDFNSLFLPFATNYTWTGSYYLNGIELNNIGSKSLSSNEVDSLLSNQTSQIQNDINNMSDSINNNIKDNFNTCKKNYFSPSISSGNYYGVDVTLNEDGSIKLYGTATSFGFINLGYSDLPNENIPTEFNSNCSSNGYCLPPINDLGYTKDNNIVWYIVYEGWSYDKTIYPMITKGTPPSTYLRPGEEVCQNKIDETNDKLNDVNNSINDLNSSITDDSGPDTSGLGDVAGWLPPGPVDSILNLPLTLFNSITSALSSNTCQVVRVKIPFIESYLELPCITSLYDKIPGLSTWIHSISVLACAWLLFTYLLNLYKWVDQTLSLRENTWNDIDQWGGV